MRLNYMSGKYRVIALFNISNCRTSFDEHQYLISITNI